MKPLYALALATLFLPKAPAAAATENSLPDYLQDLDRPYRAGDWTLQCNSSRSCQIIGVVKIRKDQTGIRAIVMIHRGIAKDAKPTMRFAFVNSMGSVSTDLPDDGMQLKARGSLPAQKPLRIKLSDIDEDGAYPIPPDTVDKTLRALQSWRWSAIYLNGQRFAKMPIGDLTRLLGKMDRLQHPKRARMTDEETAKWMKEYHFVTLKSSPVNSSAPDDVMVSCDIRAHFNPPQGTRIGPDHLLWTADCPEGTKIFLQRGDAGAEKFDVRDNAGKITRHSFAYIDKQSLLNINLPKNGNDSCGRRLKMGFTGDAFVMVEDRRYDRCRAVPYAFWPVVWHPTSWKIADSGPQPSFDADQ